MIPFVLFFFLMSATKPHTLSVMFVCIFYQDIPRDVDQTFQFSPLLLFLFTVSFPFTEDF